mmetsp:Transcript_34028/g.100274  ORF Transcript_34028/g.100274 Transcript_34028/m.100274 type:complete len:399 (+) Transcript_34028:156-1352(+)
MGSRSPLGFPIHRQRAVRGRHERSTRAAHPQPARRQPAVRAVRPLELEGDQHHRDQGGAARAPPVGRAFTDRRAGGAGREHAVGAHLPAAARGPRPDERTVRRSGRRGRHDVDAPPRGPGKSRHRRAVGADPARPRRAAGQVATGRLGPARDAHRHSAPRRVHHARAAPGFARAGLSGLVEIALSVQQRHCQLARPVQANGVPVPTVRPDARWTNPRARHCRLRAEVHAARVSEATVLAHLQATHEEELELDLGGHYRAGRRRGGRGSVRRSRPELDSVLRDFLVHDADQHARRTRTRRVRTGGRHLAPPTLRERGVQQRAWQQSVVERVALRIRSDLRRHGGPHAGHLLGHNKGAMLYSLPLPQKQAHHARRPGRRRSFSHCSLGIRLDSILLIRPD